jgi:hypothetical protein
LNDDVSTYVTLGRQGKLLFTCMQISLNQMPTQTQAGGITEAYLDVGTYVKSFFTVMFAPSCTKIGEFGDHRSPQYRIHHDINWERCAVKLLHEKHRKAKHG